MWAGRGLWGLCGLVLFPMASPGCGRGRLLAFPLGRGWGPTLRSGGGWLACCGGLTPGPPGVRWPGSSSCSPSGPSPPF